MSQGNLYKLSFSYQELDIIENEVKKSLIGLHLPLPDYCKFLDKCSPDHYTSRGIAMNMQSLLKKVREIIGS